MVNGESEETVLRLTIYHLLFTSLCRVAGAQGGDARAQTACERSAWKVLALFPARGRLVGRLAVNQRKERRAGRAGFAEVGPRVRPIASALPAAGRRRGAVCRPARARGLRA